MMLRIVDIRPVNSIVFVQGGGDFEVPSESFEPKVSLVAASSSCLIVGLFPEIDGPTQLHIGAAEDVDLGWPAAFAGTIETPAHALIIDTVDEELVHRQDEPSKTTAIKIWLSDHRWPEHVFIGID
jgi:hypothetical protein